MDALALNAWAADYQRLNEWDEQVLLAHLPHETIEESGRAYFQLSARVLAWARVTGDASEWEALRMQEYLAVTERWLRLAHPPQYVSQP